VYTYTKFRNNFIRMPDSKRLLLIPRRSGRNRSNWQP